ncbi:MAG: ferredoxin family protein [Planctomycetota bacterium]|jgi:adenylylsulfate reductase subunit B|nr:ferredoxin family protein [Planctomycetota bacterium]
MSVEIDAARCLGCGACVAICPGDLLELQDGQVIMRQADDCWRCAACLKACPAGALSLRLAAVAGGRGWRLSVTSQDNRLLWRCLPPQAGEAEIIFSVDPQDPNPY